MKEKCCIYYFYATLFSFLYAFCYFQTSSLGVPGNPPKDDFDGKRRVKPPNAVFTNSKNGIMVVLT